MLVKVTRKQRRRTRRTKFPRNRIPDRPSRRARSQKAREVGAMRREFDLGITIDPIHDRVAANDVDATTC